MKPDSIGAIEAQKKRNNDASSPLEAHLSKQTMCCELIRRVCYVREFDVLSDTDTLHSKSSVLTKNEI